MRWLELVYKNEKRETLNPDENLKSLFSTNIYFMTKIQIISINIDNLHVNMNIFSGR
jgi:hypothetical protein